MMSIDVITVIKKIKKKEILIYSELLVFVFCFFFLNAGHLCRGIKKLIYSSTLFPCVRLNLTTRTTKRQQENFLPTKTV